MFCHSHLTKYYFHSILLQTAGNGPYVIGLTGGIASGKTTICGRLNKLGAHVISCDQLGHLAYQKGTKCYQEMVDYFGASILDFNHEIDRKKLGPIVFSDQVYFSLWLMTSKIQNFSNILIIIETF